MGDMTMRFASENRFGSKEELMLAALGPPKEIPWVASLEAGPDERPIREQLVQHANVMSAYFQNLHAGLGVLQAAGISHDKCSQGRRGAPGKGYQAFVAWLSRAQEQNRLAKCDAEALASTVLGALYGWALTARVCGEPTGATADERYVERFIEILWNGIGLGEG
jgi:AcrR family transcriptional regulator